LVSIWASNAEDDRPADRAIESLMNEELTRKIVAWATEIASCVAELPSSRARDAYLAERRRELIAGAVAEGTRSASGRDCRARRPGSRVSVGHVSRVGKRNKIESRSPP
jgi:hypothetical protein